MPILFIGSITVLINSFPIPAYQTFLDTFLGGALISWVNYLLLRRLLAGKGETGLAMASPVRMLLSAAYLAALYFLGKYTGLSSAALA